MTLEAAPIVGKGTEESEDSKDEDVVDERLASSRAFEMVEITKDFSTPGKRDSGEPVRTEIGAA